MEVFPKSYKNFNDTLFKTLASNAIQHRKNSGLGLWLAPLIGLSSAITILREDSSYSEICLLTGITGIGLIISCLCLVIGLSMGTTAIQDFQVLYFFPAMLTSVLFLFYGGKGLLASVTWGLTIGTLGSWGVLQVMSHLPGCFTIGEASAVVQSGILFVFSTIVNLPQRYHLPPIHSADIATVILQVGIIFVATVCLLCILFPKFRTPRWFYMMMIILFLFGLLPILHIILDQSPLLWILYYIFNNVNRVFMVCYWMLCLALGIGVILYQIMSDSEATPSARKSFHILIVIAYIPGMIAEPILLYLASGIAMGIFSMLELMRILELPPLGDVLQLGFSVFRDEKDILISLTPLYLLAGLSFPLWLPVNDLTLLPLLSGVFTVGIGDTAAGVFGSKYGKHKWLNTKKTIEGTVACICSQLLVAYALTYFTFIGDFWILLRFTFAVIEVSLVEAWTDQVDNLALPVSMYLALSI